MSSKYTAWKAGMEECSSSTLKSHPFATMKNGHGCYYKGWDQSRFLGPYPPNPPDPAPTQTLDLTGGRVGTSPETWIDPRAVTATLVVLLWAKWQISNNLSTASPSETTLALEDCFQTAAASPQTHKIQPVNWTQFNFHFWSCNEWHLFWSIGSIISSYIQTTNIVVT